MTNTQTKIQQIDAVLPQTQCGLCSYAGCRPYAEAIITKQEKIDRCPPGGISVLKQIAEITAQDPSPFFQEMQQKTKPSMRAVIREAECIGCTKCIQVCPVDAIVGAAKQMHTIIAVECTGCELCVAPCPVDCIDMLILPENNSSEKTKQADLARKRYENRQIRLAKNKAMQENNEKNSPIVNKQDLLITRKLEIQAAILRAKAKKR